MTTRQSYERRLQLLVDRAGRRWSRRLAHRLRVQRWNKPLGFELRILEGQAEALFRRLNEAAGPDPLAAQLRRAGEIEPPNPDDPDDELGL